MRPQRPLLIVLVGIPRSGKTTWLRARIKEARGEIGVVNIDAIHQALHGQWFSVQARDLVHGLALFMVRYLFKLGHPVVVLEAANWLEGQRRLWIADNGASVSGEPEWDTEFYVFNTPPGECLTRRREAEWPGEGGVTMNHVIEGMAGQWEDPTSDTHGCPVHSIS
jgi:predicted kinase